MGRVIKARELEASSLGVLRGADQVAAELTAAAGEAVRLRRDARREIVDLALHVAGRMVGRAVELHPGVVDDCYRRALDAAGPVEGARVSVHPEDRGSSRIDALAGEAGFEVVDDPEVGRGGCRVEAGAREVDATLDGMLARLAAALEEG